MKNLEKDLHFIGPPLSFGPLPAVFYFSLSSDESLSLDPFNQPAVALSGDDIRIFSLTIPGHEDGKEKTKAIEEWASEFKEGRDPLTSFFEKSVKTIQSLSNEGYFTFDQCALMGLSRGAFIACHIASRMNEIKTILGFAPLTHLSGCAEFQELGGREDIQAFNLPNLIPELSEKTIRFYIGNRDRRVGTELAFQLVHDLTESAFQKKIRSLPFELIITPSMGHMGHGTSKEIFHAGASWIKNALLE